MPSRLSPKTFDWQTLEIHAQGEKGSDCTRPHCSSKRPYVSHEYLSEIGGHKTTETDKGEKTSLMTMTCEK